LIDKFIERTYAALLSGVYTGREYHDPKKAMQVVCNTWQDRMIEELISGRE